MGGSAHPALPARTEGEATERAAGQETHGRQATSVTPSAGGLGRASEDVECYDRVSMDPGARLGGGRYVVTSLLGQGSQGATYAATDEASGRAVAIKRFDVRGARGWKDVELAERETRVLATLDHPLVPRYIEHFEEDGALYLVMEQVEGETLEAVRKRDGRAARGRGASLPRVRRPRAHVPARAGLARRAPRREAQQRGATRRRQLRARGLRRGERAAAAGSSTVVGTMGYMAPEQLQGRALPASDVYAVGATALAALSGVEPETLPHKGLRVDVRTALRAARAPSSWRRSSGCSSPIPTCARPASPRHSTAS